MEILATEQFTRQARLVPESCREELLRLLEAAPRSAERRLQRLQRHVLGWKPEGARTSFWFLLPERALEQPGEPAERIAPLGSQSRSRLRRMGVPDEYIHAVQQSPKLADLEALPLDPALIDRLRFQFVQQLAGLHANVSELVRRSPDSGHFERFLHGDITELLLNLDATQRRIADLGGSGSIVVRGVAGSGKTAAALHRVHGLLRQGSLLAKPQVLFLTYNRSLAAAARELLLGMGIRPGDIEAETVHAFCRRVLGASPRVLRDDERRELIMEARNEVRRISRDSALWEYSVEFWEDEIQRIKSNVADDLREYVALTRLGSGRALDGSLRAMVWKVHERYQELCDKKRTLDWAEVVRRAYLRLRDADGGHVRFDHVIVDEAQDLAVMALRLANLLVRRGGSLFIAYDRAQTIYEKRGFSWKDCGIRVHGSRSFDLKLNYRNTAQILAAARPLWDAIRSPDETEGLLEPEGADRQGPPPRLLPTQRNREYQAVADDIATILREEAVPPQNVAVLCFPNRVRDGVAKALSAKDVRFQRHSAMQQIQLADPTVKLLPLKSAKGLEFPVVYLLASAHWFRPPASLKTDDERQDWQDNMARVFYVGMTRAMTRLTFVYDRNAPVAFIRHLIPSLPPGEPKAAP